MAGFGDFAQAIQFGVGLLGGFGHAMEQQKQAHEKEQLALLSLLSKNKDADITPIDANALAPGGEQGFGERLFGTPSQLRTREGQPAFKVGGNYFTFKPKEGFSVGSIFGTPAAPPTIAPSTGTPFPAEPPPLQVTPLTPATPVPTPTPSEAPALQGSMIRVEPSPTNRLARAKVDKALKAYDALPDALSQRIDGAVEAAVAKYPNVTPEEVWALIGVESGYNPQAKSPKGAEGLMQIMPKTAQGLGASDSTDIEQHIDAGVRYLSQLKQRYNGDTALAHAAYNAGPARVRDRIPAIPETQAHVPAVLETTRQLQARFAQEAQTGEGGGTSVEEGSPRDEDPNAPPVGIQLPTLGTMPNGRPILQLPNGGYATEYTITVTNPQINGGKPTVIPSIYGGKRVSQEEAEQIIIQNGGKDPDTGQAQPAFNSIDEAESAAIERHNREEQIIRKKGIKGSESPTGQPDTSQLVAGDATPSPRLLPAAQTPEEYAAAQIRALIPNGKIKNQEELDRLTVRYNAFLNAYRGQMTTAQKRAADLAEDEHRPHVLQMLKRVQTPEQLTRVEQWLETQPKRDILREVETFLDGTKKANNGTIPDTAALQAERYLLDANYKEPIIKSVLSRSGYVPPEEKRRTTEEEIRFKRGQEAQIAGETRREQLALDKTRQIEKDKEQTKAQAFQDVHEAMNGTIDQAKLGGMDPYDFSVKRMNMAGVHDLKLWPAQLQEEHDLRQPIKDPAKRQRVDPNTYQIQSVKNEKDAQEKGLIPVDPKTVTDIRGLNQTLHMMQQAEPRLTAMYQPGGTLENLREAKGDVTTLLRRIGAAGTAAWAEKTQADKDITALRGFLSDFAIKIDRGAFGDRGKPLKDFVDRAVKQLPNLGGDGALPDTREVAYNKWAHVMDYLEAMREVLVEGGASPPGPSTHVQRLKDLEQQAAPPPKKGQTEGDSYLQKR